MTNYMVNDNGTIILRIKRELHESECTKRSAKEKRPNGRLSKLFVVFLCLLSAFGDGAIGIEYALFVFGIILRSFFLHCQFVVFLLFVFVHRNHLSS